MKKIILEFWRYCCPRDVGANIRHLVMSAFALLACSAANAAPSTPTFDGVSIYAGSDRGNITINPFITFPYSSVAVRYGVPGSASIPYTTKFFDRNTSFVCQPSTFGIADPMLGQIKSCEVSVPSTLPKLILPSATSYEKKIEVGFQGCFFGKCYFKPAVINTEFDSIISLNFNNTDSGYYFVKAGQDFLDPDNPPIGDEYGGKNVTSTTGNAMITVWKTLPKTAGWAMASGSNNFGTDFKNGYFRYGVADKWYYKKVINGVADSATNTICGNNANGSFDPYPGQIKSCQVLVDMVASCAATTSNWTGVNGEKCGALAEATASGNTIKVSNTLAPNAGSAVLTCTNGVFNRVGSSCTVPAPAACAAAAELLWYVDNAICRGSSPALASGASSTMSNTHPNSTGSATYQCSNGSLTPTSKTCVSAKPQCDAKVGAWNGTNGEKCLGAIPTMPLEGTATIINYNLQLQGSMQTTCRNGVSYRDPGSTCTAAPGCSATKIPWKGTNSEYCEATVAAAASGGTYSLKNSYNTNLGTATATCVRGTFVASSTTCTAPSPSNSTWTTPLSENGTTVAQITGILRYGANGSYMYRPVTAGMNVSCSNAFLGADPYRGVVKNCAFSNTNAPDTWQTIATEGERPAYGGSLLARYGTTNNWSYANVPRAYNICSAAIMGDPAVAITAGVCQIFAGAPQWVDVAAQGTAFSAKTTVLARYGYAESWLYRSFSGPAVCNADFFGADPSPSSVKTCQISSATEKWTQVATRGSALISKVYPAFYRYGLDSQYVSKRLTAATSCTADTFGYEPAVGKTSVCYTLDRFSSSFDPGTDPFGFQAILAAETPTSPPDQNLSRLTYQLYGYGKAVDTSLAEGATAAQKALVSSKRTTIPDPASRLQAYMDISSPAYKLGNDASGVTFSSTQDKNEKVSKAVNDWLKTGNGTQTGMDLVTNIAEQAMQMISMEALAVSKLNLTDTAKSDELNRRLTESNWVYAGTLLATSIQLRLPNLKLPTGVASELYGNVRVSIPLVSAFGVTRTGEKRGGIDIFKSIAKGRLNVVVSLEVGKTYSALAGFMGYAGTVPETNAFQFLKGMSLGLGGEVHFSITFDTVRKLSRLDFFTIDAVADFGNFWYSTWGWLSRSSVGQYIAATDVGTAAVSAYGQGYQLWNWLRDIKVPNDAGAAAAAVNAELPTIVQTDMEADVESGLDGISATELADVLTQNDHGETILNTDMGTYSPSTYSDGVLQNALDSYTDLNGQGIFSTLVGEVRASHNKIWEVDTFEILAATTYFSPGYNEDVVCWLASTAKGQCDSTFKPGIWSNLSFNITPSVITIGAISLSGVQGRWFKDFWANATVQGIALGAKNFGATLRLHTVSGSMINYTFSADNAATVRSSGIAGVIAAH